jgi:hypothetical protein
MSPGSRRATAGALLLAGVLIFADYIALAGVAFYGTIAILFAAGFAEGRLRAVVWALLLVAAAFVGDVLWWFNVDPFDRSEEYESLPQTPFVIIALPVPMAVVAAGVGTRWLWRRTRSGPE